MPKFYVSEEHLGREATEEQAHQLITILEEQGWNVEYGDERSDATEDEKLDFEKAFYQALNQIS